MPHVLTGKSKVSRVSGTLRTYNNHVGYEQGGRPTHLEVPPEWIGGQLPVNMVNRIIDLSLVYV